MSLNPWGFSTLRFADIEGPKSIAGEMAKQDCFQSPALAYGDLL